MGNNIIQFNSGSTFRKGIMMYLANFFNLKNEKQKILKYFSKIDKDNDGELTFEELVDSYYKIVWLLLVWKHPLHEISFYSG